MVDEIGVVTEVEGVTAKVLVRKKGMCDGCAVGGTCKSTEKGMEINALNQVSARTGQTVRVSIGPQAYLKESILVYGMPLVFFIAGTIAGKTSAGKYFAGINSDLAAAAGGIIALALSLLLIKIWSGRAESRAGNRPVIEEIIK